MYSFLLFFIIKISKKKTGHLEPLDRSSSDTSRSFFHCSLSFSAQNDHLRTYFNLCFTITHLNHTHELKHDEYPAYLTCDSTTSLKLCTGADHCFTCTSPPTLGCLSIVCPPRPQTILSRYPPLWLGVALKPCHFEYSLPHLSDNNHYHKHFTSIKHSDSKPVHLNLRSWNALFFWDNFTCDCS